MQPHTQTIKPIWRTRSDLANFSTASATLLLAGLPAGSYVCSYAGVACFGMHATHTSQRRTNNVSFGDLRVLKISLPQCRHEGKTTQKISQTYLSQDLSSSIQPKLLARKKMFSNLYIRLFMYVRNEYLQTGYEDQPHNKYICREYLRHRT